MKRVIYDIDKSDYYLNIDRYVFYFSSEFNRTRFKEGYDSFIYEEISKLKAKYHVNINLSCYLLIVYYKKIEKRGFKVLTYDDKNDIIDLSKDYIFNVE